MTRAPTSKRRASRAAVGWPKKGEVSTPLNRTGFTVFSTFDARTYSSVSTR